jgi:hypothetical protein
MEIKDWRGYLKALPLAALVTGMTVMAARADERGMERLPFRATFSVASVVNPPVPPGLNIDRCGSPAPVQVVQGAGVASYLGVFTDAQSHCLGLPGPQPPCEAVPVGTLPFSGGEFTFTNPNDKNILGKYCGYLAPTESSSFKNGLPVGAWIIHGMVCVSGGTVFRNVVDDCMAGRYFPARGITLLNPVIDKDSTATTDGTNPGTLFLEQTIGVRHN